jgi:hypothetical protein
MRESRVCEITLGMYGYRYFTQTLCMIRVTCHRTQGEITLGHKSKEQKSLEINVILA